MLAHPMNPEAAHAAFALDAYDLVAPLGRGAMGEVWRGVHRGQGASVAIKVLTGPLARKPQYLTAFREEVRAVAMLDHPHIVAVYDYGHVTAASSAASGGRYPEGSPYLVMEIVDGGSMGSMCGRTGWVELYQMLIALLDALGHAHARGLVHRDLKPHNVLVPAEGASHGVRLTDFGLAHALYRDTDPFREHMAGTPNYMAPEQVRCAWRDYGPWTDLYALGCIAYALVSGKPPFRRVEPQDTLQAHLYVPAPPIAREGLPAGFEGWVHRLLAKDPAERYQRAADAAWALMRLAEGHVGGAAGFLNRAGAVSSRPDLPQLDSDPASDPTEAASSVHTLTWRWDDWAGRGAPEAPEKVIELPPIPADWRRDEAMGWNPLLGVGLGLYGLRTVPMVDRYDERDALWAALRTAASTRQPQAVVLRGPAGMGKSRLGEWLGERAEELGAAIVLRALHNPIPGPRDGLGPMFARFHVCAGLDREEADARLERILRDLGESQEDAWHPLAALVAPEQGERLSSGDRYRVIETHLRRLARHRPVVMLVDDAQWGPEAVAVARRLLDVDDLRLLVVLTIEEASRMAEAGARHAMERLAGHAAVRVLAVGSLPAGHRPTLVRALLGLECEVAAEVEGRTEGSPLFAIHLVGDWVQRGALVPGAQGFTLRPGVAQRLPDGIHDIWRQRIDEVLAGRPANDRLALELAAMLGRDVEPDEWRAACERAAPAASGDLVELLVARRLAVRVAGEAGWSFAHAMLRESLLRRIDEQGRAAELHTVCADVLESRRGPGIAERRAQHLLGAGRQEDALDPLVGASWERLGNSDFKGARRLLRLWQGCVDAVGVPADDARRGHGWMITCRIARASGDLERARTLAEAAEHEARRHGWDKVLARALVDRAWDAINRGDHDAGFARMDEAASIAAALGDGTLLANCRRNQGVILLDRGEPARVEALLAEALATYREGKHPVGAALTRVNLAQLARRYGRHEEALGHLDDADALFAEAGSRWGAGAGRSGVGCDQPRGSRRGLRAHGRGGVDRGGPGRWHLARELPAQSGRDPARSGRAGAGRGAAGGGAGDVPRGQASGGRGADPGQPRAARAAVWTARGGAGAPRRRGRLVCRGGLALGRGDGDDRARVGAPRDGRARPGRGRAERGVQPVCGHRRRQRAAGDALSGAGAPRERAR